MKTSVVNINETGGSSWDGVVQLRREGNRLVLSDGEAGSKTLAEAAARRPWKRSGAIRTIVCGGDSNTVWGYGGGARDGHGAYPGQMQALALGTTALWGARFHNAGRSGEPSTQALARFSSDVLSLGPDIVTLAWGLNDIYGETAEGAGADDTQYIANVSAMIDATFAADALPVLLTIPHYTMVDTTNPAIANQTTLDATIEAWNADLRALALRKNVALFDWNALLGGSGSNDLYRPEIIAGQTPDVEGLVIHLSWRGQRATASALMKFLCVEVLQEGATGVSIPERIACDDAALTLAETAGDFVASSGTLQIVDRPIAHLVGFDVGLSDLSTSGVYTGAPDVDYTIRIDGAGATDTFRWSKDNGATWEATGVAITGDDQALDDGVRVRFAATTGHTLDNAWRFPSRGDRIVETPYRKFVNDSASDVEAVSFSFHGTGVALVCAQGAMGNLSVTLDGESFDVDLAQERPLWIGAAWARTGLDWREHSVSVTLKNTATGSNPKELLFMGFVVERDGAAGVSSAGATWGNVSGTLSNQTDLQEALDTKASGAPSSTDQALVRFDGASGSVFQNSQVYVDDDGWLGIGESNPDANLHIARQNMSDMVTNGAFDSDSNWTKGAGWDIDTSAAGRAYLAANNSSYLEQTSAQGFGPAVNGHVYRITYTLTSGVSQLTVYLGSVNAGSNVNTGTYSTVVTCDQSGATLKLHGSTASGYALMLDDVMVEDITDALLKIEGGGAQFEGAIVAHSYADNTPAYGGTPSQALGEVLAMGNREDGAIDHEALPAMARRTVARPFARRFDSHEQMERWSARQGGRARLVTTRSTAEAGADAIEATFTLFEDLRDLGALVTIYGEAFKALKAEIDAAHARIATIEQREGQR